MASAKHKESDSAKRAALIAALQAQPDHPLSPSELKQLTGVPKSAVRGLLTAVDGVHMSEPRVRPIKIWYSRPGGAA